MPKKNPRAGRTLLASRREAKNELLICYPTLDALLKSGKLKSIRIGKRVLIPRVELERFAAGLAA